MSIPKIVALMTKLAESTEAHKAVWEPGPDNDTFIWSGRAASVVIRSVDGDGAYPFQVRLIDDEGRIVESEVFAIQRFGEPDLRALYEQARRQALNIDSTIDDLLRELDD